MRIRDRGRLWLFKRLRDESGNFVTYSEWDDHEYYIHWFNFLPAQWRSWKYEIVPYGGVIHESQSFWFFNTTWSLPGGYRRYKRKYP